ncbi:MAG: DNA-processing protein DprA [Pseudomonadota bacterium]
MPPTQRDLIACSLAWLRADEYFALRERFGGAGALFRQTASALENAGLSAAKSRRLAHADDSEVEAAETWLKERDQHLLCMEDPAYPALLRDVRDPPLVLYVKGSIDLLALPSLAIVGSRNPTRGGVNNARDFAAHLGKLGFTITSGLAEGIDATAHEAALDSGAKSIAVLGTGIDRVYPAGHRELAHRIAEAGALVSEYPLGTPPRRQHFPERNRIITGLCLGVLVVEAASRSGSLISARLAAEQGREVFAIPGSIHNALARGCHKLIRQGAKLVETANDIVSELEPLVTSLHGELGADSPRTMAAEERNEAHDNLLNTIGHDPVGIDELLEQSGLTIDELSSMLLILELEGKIERLAGGQYARLGKTAPDIEPQP